MTEHVRGIARVGRSQHALEIEHLTAEKFRLLERRFLERIGK